MYSVQFCTNFLQTHKNPQFNYNHTIIVTINTITINIETITIPSSQLYKSIGTKQILIKQH